MSSHDHDAAFHSLPPYLQRRVHSAFDSAFRRSHPNLSESQPKRRKLHSDSEPGGGFIVDEAQSSSSGGGFLVEEAGGGGFIVEDASVEGGGGFIVEDESRNASETESSETIPLESIPFALQLLDLPPDDEQVLAVFRNAASGWDGKTADGTLGVTQKDFFAVCAILLEPGEGGDDTEDGFATTRSGSIEGDDQSEFDVQMQSGDDEANSDDDYEPADSPHRRRTRSKPSATRGKRRVRGSRVTYEDSHSEDESGSDIGGSKPLTSRQKKSCLEAFALFFPDDSGATLTQRRIMLSDIQRVSKLLGEKLKAEEMLEMVEAFSTSPDKSMGLEDFERMMIAAKLA